MVALTRDFHVVASRVTACLSAVLFSFRYIAKAWYMRALSRLLIAHYNSVLSGTLILSDHSRSATHAFHSLRDAGSFQSRLHKSIQRSNPSE